jgi:hypothetical protein
MPAIALEVREKLPIDNFWKFFAKSKVLFIQEMISEVVRLRGVSKN